MRWLLSVPVLAVVLSVGPAQDRPDDVVKAAVKAAGGADVLAKYPAGRVVGKGTMTFGGDETAFTCEQAYQVPGKLRTVVRCEVKGQKWELLQVASGDKAAQTINGRAVPLTDAGAKELQLALLLNEVSQLTPLTSDRKFTLKPDKPAKGPDAALVVHARGYPDLRLGFDRKTGHLIRIAYKATDPDTAKEAETETTFSEFKEVSGLTRPTRSVVTRDGKKVLDLVVEKFTPLEKIDPKAFAIDE
jgi:hypothetical protein